MKPFSLPPLAIFLFFGFSLVLSTVHAARTTSIDVTVYLHGIGRGGDNVNASATGNLSPLTPTRSAAVEFYDANNNLALSTTGTIAYNAPAGSFTGTINADALPTGVYLLKIKTKQYLRRQISGIVTLTKGKNTNVQAVSLIAGDIIDNNTLDVEDYRIILDCFSELAPPLNCSDNNKKILADLNDDGNVNQFDYNLFLRELSVQYGEDVQVPTNTITPTITPAPTTGASSGIWISQTEIMKLPTNGTPWNNVKNAAYANWGSSCLDYLDCLHDTYTLAGALVYVRTGDQALRTKVIDGIHSAMRSNLYRTLELARNLQCYVIAADLIDYHDPSFESWLDSVIHKTLPGRGGFDTVWDGAIGDSTNWGNHQRAASIAVYLYLHDSSKLAQLANTYKEYIGLPVASTPLVYDPTNWIADQNNKAGVNRKGAMIEGKVVSGVLPEDWRRGTEFQWPPAITGYMWEGMQGFVVSSVLLQRAGLVSFTSGDNAVVRAMNMLYGQGEAANNSPVFNNPPSGDDQWIPWVVNYYGGTSYSIGITSPGKNMGWTDWTHQ
jgi:hypothetical protein